VPRAVTAVGGRGMLVPPCMPRHASGVSLTLGCPPVHEESRVHGSGDGLHRRELHGVWRGGGAYRGRVRVQAVQRLLLQRCNLLGVTCSIRRSRRTSSSDCTSSLWRKSSGCSRASCLKSACRKKSEYQQKSEYSLCTLIVRECQGRILNDGIRGAYRFSAACQHEISTGGKNAFVFQQVSVRAHVRCWSSSAHDQRVTCAWQLSDYGGG
jgi:hypothetical protein